MNDARRRDRLIGLLGQLEDLVVAEVDADGTIAVSTGPARPPLAWSAGSCWVDSVGEAHRDALRAALADAIATRTPAWVEAEAPGPDAEPRWVLLRVAPLAERASVVVVGRDVTEQHRTEAQLEATRLESLGPLAAGIAHEINNPLAAVIANLDLALRDTSELAERVALPPDLVDELRDARDAAERLRTIMRDLRTFAAPDTDRRAAVDVQRVVESALRVAWNELRHRARVVKLYGEVPPVEGNESRLGRLFFHLLLHLGRVLPVGQADRHELRVLTTAAADRVVVTVVVAEAGAEVAADAWTPYSGTSGPAPPRGDGVAAAWRTVVALGGTVETARSGRGVRVALRAARQEVAPATPSASRPARRGRVLLVDDEPMMGGVVRRTLGADHDVVALTSAAAALALLDAGERFDVVLCDVMMPHMTGVELYGILAARHPDHARRVIFLSGGTFTQAAREFLERCPNVQLEKPFDGAVLRSVVNERVR